MTNADLRERGHLEELGVDGRIILEWIFKKLNVKVWTGAIWLKIGTGMGELVNAALNLRVQQNVQNFLTSR